MITFPEIISRLKKQTSGYYADRALSQLEYASKLSLVDGGKHDALVEDAAQLLNSAFIGNGALTKADCIALEHCLSPLSSRAKSFGMRFISHAHIDMNWMWGYAETVEITLESFRTILRMMDEYPGFTYGQSQASVYKIVELHEPEMLESIRRRIREGRWEVTAATWVEGDKNMASVEAQSRHLLYTKAYLSKLLGLGDGDFSLDFEPDTFGHSRNVPEILNAAGVKYYYHCRALKGNDSIYRWRAPSGAEVLANREFFWYNSAPDPFMAMWTPEFCAKYNIPYTLRVYGVGDHGGGPTRRDIERILDMKTWPIFPSVDFGTYRDYYAELEKVRDSLPVIDCELNPQFSGCYTTQSRIKAFNRIGEKRLASAETLTSMASAFNGGFRPLSLESAWENVLFSQFHDILPGSGVTETREYASGIAQQSLAAANTAASRAMREIASTIDTSALPAESRAEFYDASTSEGGGVGFGVTSFGLPQAERGRGVNRIFHLFNGAQDSFDGLTEITVWDWPGDLSRMVFHGPDGAELSHQLLPSDGSPNLTGNYWGHVYNKIAVCAAVPPFGYATITLGEKPAANSSAMRSPDDVPEKPCEYVLENELVRVVFDPTSFGIVSFADKAGARDLASKERPAGVLRVIHEDNNGMEAWRVGKYAEICRANPRTRILSYAVGKLRGSISYYVRLTESSHATVTVSLDRNARKLDFRTDVTWLEDGSSEYLPQLNAYFPFSYSASSYAYAVPMGIITRKAANQDLPALGFVAALQVAYEDNRCDGNHRCGGHPLYLWAATKYGFRCNDDALSLTLLRSAINPDHHPELGDHSFTYSYGIADSDSDIALEKLSRSIGAAPVFCSGTVHSGSLPMSGSAFVPECLGATISCVKRAEDGRGYIFRIYEVAGGSRVDLSFPASQKIVSAELCDIHENPLEALSAVDSKLSFSIKPYGMVTLRVDC